MRERRRHERYETPHIPVQLSEIDAQLIDLSLSGAAVTHRSPITAGESYTLVFPSYTGFYIPCEVLRSVVQVQEGARGREYVFRTSLTFTERPEDQSEALVEFINLQISRLEKAKEQAFARETTRDSDSTSGRSE